MGNEPTYMGRKPTKGERNPYMQKEKVYLGFELQIAKWEMSLLTLRFSHLFVIWQSNPSYMTVNKVFSNSYKVYRMGLSFCLWESSVDINCLIYIPLDWQLADIFTKPLDEITFVVLQYSQPWTHRVIYKRKKKRNYSKIKSHIKGAHLQWRSYSP